MADLGHRLTDIELAKLERKIKGVYSEAAKDMQKQCIEYFRQFEERDKQMLQLVENDEWTEEEYKMWRLNQIGRGKRFEAMRDKLAERATSANEVAIAYVNDATPSIYSLNRNFAAYTIESVADNVSFTLFDEGTIRRLLAESPETMPYYPEKRAVARGIDLAYGKKQITSTVTSGILRGQSIKQLSDELQHRISTISQTSAIRAARTAVTSAQNGGRQDSYTSATNMGIRMKKEWMATLDARTRIEHGMADGQKVDVDKPFIVGGEKMMFPADPNGSGWNTYNCRCTMVADLLDYPDAKPRMTYSEWEKEKKSTKKVFTSEQSHNILYRKQVTPQNPNFIPISDRMFESLVAGARTQGAVIYRGGEAAEKLLKEGDRAACLGDVLVFRDKVCKTDVHEELRHFWQNMNNFLADADYDVRDDLLEIDAKEYLISNAKKLKIPRTETEETKKELEFYKKRLESKNGNTYS